MKLNKEWFASLFENLKWNKARNFGIITMVFIFALCSIALTAICAADDNSQSNPLTINDLINELIKPEIWKTELNYEAT